MRDIGDAEIKFITSAQIVLIDYPEDRFYPDEMLERGLRAVHARVSIRAQDRLGWKKRFLILMQLTKDNKSSEIVELFQEAPEESFSAEFVLLGLDQSPEFDKIRAHVNEVISDEMQLPGEYSKQRYLIGSEIE